MAHSAEEIRSHVRFYIGIFVALIILTIITVAVDYVHIGPADSDVANVVVGLLIATVKAGLVAAFFMHLTSEKPMIFRFLFATVAFVIAMFILMLLAHFDPIAPVFGP